MECRFGHPTGCTLDILLFKTERALVVLLIKPIVAQSQRIWPNIKWVLSLAYQRGAREIGGLCCESLLPIGVMSLLRSIQMQFDNNQ